jgi:hypothetical protein
MASERAGAKLKTLRANQIYNKIRYVWTTVA